MKKYFISGLTGIALTVFTFYIILSISTTYQVTAQSIAAVIIGATLGSITIQVLLAIYDWYRLADI